MSRALVLIAVRRQPFEVLVLAWSLEIALLHWLKPPPVPAGLDAVLAPWMVTTWYAGLGCTGVVGLFAMILRHVQWSLLLERGSMVVVCGFMAVWLAADIYTFGFNQWTGESILFTWSLAAAWRALQLSLDLRQIGHARE